MNSTLWLIAIGLLLCATLTAGAFFDPTIGRWASRDPIEERAGMNLCAFAGNSAPAVVDLLGLCKVCASGQRWRVDIATLDSHQQGTPYQDLADAAQKKLNSAWAFAGITIPRFSTTGPFAVGNQKSLIFSNEPIPGNSFFAVHFLFFIDFEIDESSGPCTMELEESGSSFWRKLDGTTANVVTIKRTGPPDGYAIKSARRSPLGCCDKTYIYVDAPGNLVFKGTEHVMGWGEHTHIKATLRVKDKSTTVSASSYEVTIDGDSGGNITIQSP